MIFYEELSEPSIHNICQVCPADSATNVKYTYVALLSMKHGRGPGDKVLIAVNVCVWFCSSFLAVT